MVSIIMPAYNAEKTIVFSIESVLSQSYSDLELIIINDCSKDGTKEIVEHYAKSDNRVVVINNKENQGVSKSRNIGIQVAKGEYIAFLDSDDIWDKSKLKKQLHVMKKYNAVLSYTASAFIDETGNSYRYIMEAEKRTSLRTLLKKNLISCSSAMVKSSVMKKIKMPNDNMHEDYYVWIKILKKYKYAYGINEPLLTYRLMTKSKSSNRLKSAKMIFNTYRAVQYSAITSCFLTARYTIHSVTKRYKIKHCL